MLQVLVNQRSLSQISYDQSVPQFHRMKANHKMTEAVPANPNVTQRGLYISTFYSSITNLIIINHLIVTSFMLFDS